MRFEVPQFIEIEDKIFGPFTWRQFIYLMGGGGIAVVLFLTTNFIVFVILGIPLGVLGFLLAFYPVNNRPFATFLESAVSFYSTSKLYLWRKKTASVYKSEPSIVRTSSPAASFTPPTANSSLSSLSRRLELEAIQKESE